MPTEVKICLTFRQSILQYLNDKDFSAVDTNTAISVCTACPNKKLHNTSTSSLQHHMECKRLPTTLGIQKQPLLAVEPKNYFTGNKNKTGFSKRDLGVTKTRHTYRINRLQLARKCLVQLHLVEIFLYQMSHTLL